MMPAVIVGWVWQGLLIALTALLVLRAFPGVSAATRHAVLWMALIVTILIPGILTVMEWLQAGGQTAIQPTADAAGAAAPVVISLPRLSPEIMLAVVTIWAGVLVCRAVRMFRGLRTLRRIKQQARPLAPHRERQLALWSAHRPAGRPCELRISEERIGPCAAGLRRPMILLPEALVRTLSNEEIDQIVLHEHAHVLRYDDWSRLVQCVLAALFDVHPAVWLLNRHIDVAREAACDDRVVRITRAPQRYAACLTRAAEICLAGPCEPSIVPGATRSFRVLRARVMRLLDGAERPSRGGWRAAAASVVVLGVSIAAVSLASPIQFDEWAPAQRPAPTRIGEDRLSPTERPVPARERRLAPAQRPVPARERRLASARWPASTGIREDGPASAQQPTLIEVADGAAPLPGEPLGSGIVAGTPEIRSRSAAAAPASANSRFDASTFTTVGTDTAHAGVRLGHHLQRMGESLGGWFAGAARAASTP